jgi:hypothetical protein
MMETQIEYFFKNKVQYDDNVLQIKYKNKTLKPRK